jgi:hypothetical protein
VSRKGSFLLEQKLPDILAQREGTYENILIDHGTMTDLETLIGLTETKKRNK